jgi:hypothetical protein
MSINYTPRTWVAGETVTAALFNQEIRDPLIGMQTQYIPYTPTWTGLTLGNATQQFRYHQIGKQVHYYGRLTFGSTTTITSGSGCFPSMPVTPFASGGFGIFHTGDSWGFDNGAATWYPGVFQPAGAFYFPFQSIKSTTPLTTAPVAGDILQFSIRYEAA